MIHFDPKNLPKIFIFIGDFWLKKTKSPNFNFSWEPLSKGAPLFTTQIPYAFCQFGTKSKMKKFKN